MIIPIKELTVWLGKNKIQSETRVKVTNTAEKIRIWKHLFNKYILRAYSNCWEVKWWSRHDPPPFPKLTFLWENKQQADKSIRVILEISKSNKGSLNRVRGQIMAGVLFVKGKPLWGKAIGGENWTSEATGKKNWPIHFREGGFPSS